MQDSDSRWMQTLTGARIRVRTPGAQTDSRLTIVDFIEPPKSNPPVFTKHEFIEVFTVFSGTLCFQFMDEPCVELCSGESVACPSYKPHSFWNETDEPVEVQLVCSPAGLDEFFVESDALLKNSSITEEDFDAKRLELRTKFGLEHVGLPPPRRVNPGPQ